MAASIRSTSVLLALVLGVAAMTAPPAIAPAHAQKAKSEKEKKKLAKQYTEAGLAAQEAGEYDKAIELYNMAYEVVPHPILIFNVGQAQRLAGRDEEALVAYERYLAEDPKGAKAKEAKAFLKEIQPRVEKARIDRAERERIAAEAETARLAAEAAEAERLRLEAEAAKRAAEQPAEEPEEPAAAPSRGGGRKRLGLVIGGGGLAIAATGAVFGVLARGRWSDAEAVCGADGVCDSQADIDLSRSKADGARTFGNVSTALIAGGVVAVGVGAVLWLTAPSGSRAPADRAAWILPSADADGVYVTLGGAL